MKLSHIEVENFKSFRNTHTIGPFTSMTGIVGPNGCGKSNIVDALTFVFEIENARNNHPISSGKQSSVRAEKCSVTVFLEENNKQKKIFKKTQFKKKENSYWIDNQSVNKQEYIKSLQDLNIGSHSFMLQGETDKLIKKNPEELAEIIERACGSIEFKNKYDEATLKLKSVTEETSQLLVEQKNLRKEDIKQKAISEQNEKYQALNEQIKVAELKVEQANFFQIDRALLGEMKLLEIAKNNLDEKKTQELALRRAIQTNNIKSKEVSKELTKKEQEREALKNEIKQLQREMQNEEEKLSSSQSLRDNPQLKKNLEEQMSQLKDSLAVQKQVLQKEEKILEELSSSENLKSKVENKKIRDHYEEYQELGRVCNSQVMSLQLELKKLTNDLSNSSAELKTAQESERTQNSHIDGLNTKVKEAKDLQKQKEAELIQKEKNKSVIQTSLQELEKERKETQKKISTIQQQLNILLANKQALEYELESMEEMRNQDKVYRELHKIKGFYGQLSDLVKNSSHKHHELAIKIALGTMLNCLVVDSPSSALDVNVILSGQELARDVMILRNLPNVSNDKLCNAMIGNLGEVAAGLVDIDERNGKYEDNPELKKRIGETLRYLLRGKVVCDSVEKAFKLRGKRLQEIRQIITRDGDVISSGSIQISSSDKEKYSKKDLGTASNIAQLEKKISNEDKQIEKKMKEYEGLKNLDSEKQYNKLMEQLNNEEQSIELIKTEISAAKEKAKKLEDKKNGIRGTVAKSMQVINLEKVVEQLEERVQRVQQSINQKREEVFDSFCKKYKLNIKECVLQSADNLERSFIQIERQQSKVGEVSEQIRVTEEKKNALQRAVEKYEGSRKKYENMEKDFIETKKKIEKQREEKDNKYKEIATVCNEKSKEIKKIEEENEKYYEELVGKPNAIKKEIISIKHSIGQLVDRKETAWQDCTLRQIDFKVNLKNKKDEKVEIGEEDEEEEEESNNDDDGDEDIEKQPNDTLNSNESNAQSLSRSFSQSLKSYTHVISQFDDNKLKEQLDKFKALEMLNYTHLFVDKNQFLNKRKMQQQVDKGLSQIEALIESVDISSLVGYQQRLVDELDELRKKIEEYASKDLAEGLIGNTTSEEVRQKREILKKKQGELILAKKAAEEELRATKKLRKDAFDNFFSQVQLNVKQYYEELTRLKGKNQSTKGNADLTVSNEDEKYKGGITYFCCPPKKAYALNPQKELSGGEKTLAQLALFLAIAKDSPFLVLDESEAALDSNNTQNVLHTLAELISNKQKLIVSHNLDVYSNCESLIGATFDRKTDSSFTLSLNLKEQQ